MDNVNTPVDAGSEVVATPQTDVVDNPVIEQPATTEQPEVVTPAQEKPKQDKDTNAAFAEMRRKTEKAEKDVQIARKYGKDYDVYSEEDIAKKFGDSHNIHTLADFEKALQNEAYRERGIDPDAINELVENHPAMQQAKQANFNAQLQKEIDEVNKEFADCGFKTIDEFLASPQFDAIAEKYKHGNSLVDSYFLVNRSNVIQKQSEAAKQQALNSINGKQHIQPNGQGTDINTVTVPADVMAMYKKLTPGKSEEFYTEHYKNSLRS